MSETSQPVTDAELAVLNVLWEQGSSSTRSITEALYSSATDSDYATVQKLLHRLEAKGHVVRDRSSFAHVVRPAATRDEFAASQLEALADKLSGGSLVPLLAHLVEARRLTARERDKLRRLLDTHDERPRR
jgi:BlaI family penicillinase repressor